METREQQTDNILENTCTILMAVFIILFTIIWIMAGLDSTTYDAARDNLVKRTLVHMYKIGELKRREVRFHDKNVGISTKVIYKVILWHGEIKH